VLKFFDADPESFLILNKFFGLKLLKFFDADSGSGIRKFFFEPGSGMEKFATLLGIHLNKKF
jgi:hypothetical protein